MRKLVTVVSIIVVLLTGCTVKSAPAPSSTPIVTVTATPVFKPTPNEAVCRAAIVVDYQEGWAGDSTWPPSTGKPACAGFNRPTLERLIDEAIDDIMNGTTGP